MLKVRGILFDLYDTLVHFEAEAHRERNDCLARICGVAAADFDRAWRGLVCESNLGAFPRTEDRARRVLEILGIEPSEGLVSGIAGYEHRHVRTSSRLYPDSLETLARLRAHGFALGLVTNASPSVWEVIRSKDLTPHLNCIVVSSQIGIRKPDPRIYLHALHLLDVGAAEAAFVGDGNDQELDGAKAVGMTTIWINRVGFRPVVSEQSTPMSVDYEIKRLSQIPGLLDLEG
jgi:putative hydrolase of the HAD superfamily